MEVTRGTRPTGALIYAVKSPVEVGTGIAKVPSPGPYGRSSVAVASIRARSAVPMPRAIVLIDILGALPHTIPYGEELVRAFLACNAIEVS